MNSNPKTKAKRIKNPLSFSFMTSFYPLVSSHWQALNSPNTFVKPTKKEQTNKHQKQTKTMNLITKIFLLTGAFCFYTILSMASDLPHEEEVKYTISGKIKSASDGEDLIGATVLVKEINQGAVTNVYGFYSLTLKPGKYTLVISYIGYESQQKTIDLTTNMAANFELVEVTNNLQEVVVTAERADAHVSDVKMSTVTIDMIQVKKLPPLFGEPDLVKIVQMQPGVISAGEGTSSFFVRGGAADQNLILIDEAPVYDPSHMFGLFSVFNADIIKSSELYKGGIPAQFGGRLSSILDVRVKDGNSKALSGSFGIGLLAAKASLEGPILKDKASFLLSARRSYAGYYLRFSEDENQNQNNVFFYDYNAKVNLQLNQRNRLFVSAYLGRDVFRFGDDFQIDWGNATSTIRWNHVFSDRLFSNTTAIFSNFDYALQFNEPVLGFRWTANIRESTIKQDLSWFINPDHQLSFGASTAYKVFSPGKFKPTSDKSIYSGTTMQELHSWDNALYASHEAKLSSRIKAELGLRVSIFSQLGPYEHYTYRDPYDLRNVQRIDSQSFERATFVKTFINPEPRLSIRYSLDPQSSIKASYNRMVQNTHQMITGTTPTPTSIWLPSGAMIKPQTADQVAAGYFRNLFDNKIETSAELYYKKMDGVIDFADNAQVFFNQDLATVLRPGWSDSYGAEFLVKKTRGKLNGWISYTWSKTTRYIEGVNQNQAFPASYDRRHNTNLVLTYDLNERWSFGANWVYGTGRPITLPAGKYQYKHFVVDEYTSRNGFRLPDFHRLDLSATLKSRSVPGRKWSSEWNFSLYNAYNRKNPFTIYTRTVQDSEGNTVQGSSEKEAVMIYLFPILPSISYNLKF
jgi:hypothetical protein